MRKDLWTGAAALALLAAMSTSPAGAEVTRSDVHGDWRVTCVQRESGQQCAASQIQTDRESGARALAIELHRTEEGGIRGALALPFGLALQAGVRISLDEGGPFGDVRRFSTCLPDGCIVPLNLDADAARQFEAAAVLNIHAIAVSDGQRVQFQVSLDGLSAALKAFPQP